MYFISAADILLASLALIVQVSLPYNKTGRASVLYKLTLVFFSHKNQSVMMYAAQVAVYSEINTKHIQCEKKVKSLNVKPVGATCRQ
jgi:ABC-type dipeptide/oligopeptide/nickel transport system ATPase subunit